MWCADGKFECIDPRDLGFPIGLVEEIGEFIASAQVQLNPGDVVLYTEGIPEAFDINKAQHGLKRRMCGSILALRRFLMILLWW